MRENGITGAAGDVQQRVLLVLDECAGGNRGQMARDLGLTRQAVSAWTRGASTPSLQAAAKLCEVYPVRPAWMLAGKGEPFREEVGV